MGIVLKHFCMPRQHNLSLRLYTTHPSIYHYNYIQNLQSLYIHIPMFSIYYSLPL
uniref:Uncharacterized protein n=1 Tax=uncultured marine virus TaxID=186617 RepID=A0A0F7L5I2_9VIRU|nr:hypothetical protein [uncultured marine virus]